MTDNLNPSALTCFVTHAYMRSDALPVVGAMQLTTLAKPPAHMLKRAKAAPNVTREAHVYAGWSHRGKVRIGEALHSVWERPGQWATTLGAKPPELDCKVHGSLPELLERSGATQYLGTAHKSSKRKKR